MNNSTTIQCPNCATQIDVNDILKHQIEEGMRQEFIKEKNLLIKQQKEKEAALFKRQQEKEQELQKEQELREAAFLKQQEEFDEKRKKANELFQQRLEDQRKKDRQEIELRIKTKLAEDSREQLKAMQEELAEKSEKVKDLLKKEAEIERLKREKNEAAEVAKLEAQKELSLQLQEAKEKIKRQEAESHELKIKELQLQLDQQKTLTEEMRRKQEQGSMQLQGETMELAIEEWLTSQFPLDTIDEIKKGANGADCLQIINTREQTNCGIIYYESKRTKTFQPSWIEKFKNDIRERNATIGVLVTQVTPSDMDRMELRDGIWICNYEEFKGLCAVLRQSIVQWSRIKQNQENRGDKMGLLYDFLTSSEFRLQMEGIVEGFTQMQLDLQKEKNAMNRIWKQREKQIDKVINNAIGMHASIKGIAGSAIQSIPALELDEGDDDEVLSLDMN